MAQKILDTLTQPAWIDNREIAIAGGIGISLYPRDGTNGEALVKHADMAMYHAKQDGRSRFLFYSGETMSSN